MAGAVHEQAETGAGADARHADDPVIYFTLVDFLIQLLFFGLFLVVVLRFGGGKRGEIQAWVPPEIKMNLPFYKGMADLVHADSQGEMLEALQKLKEQGLLEAFLKFATETGSPLEMIQFCAADPALCKELVGQCGTHADACKKFAGADKRGVERMVGALGLRPCRADARPLFSIVGYGDGRPGRDGHYEIREVYPAGTEDLPRAGISLSNSQRLSKAEAQTMFGGVSKSVLNCAHFIEYVASETDSDTLRAILERPFYLRVKSLRNGVLTERRVSPQ